MPWVIQRKQSAIPRLANDEKTARIIACEDLIDNIGRMGLQDDEKYNVLRAIQAGEYRNAIAIFNSFHGQDMVAITHVPVTTNNRTEISEDHHSLMLAALDSLP